MINKIKISPYGNMLVYQKGYTAEFVKDTINKNNLEGLRIFDHLDRLESLDFLKKYTFLKKLHIDCVYDQDYSFLRDLYNLEDLTIGGSITNINEINLSNQQNLKKLGITWRKKITGIENCIKLTWLTLVEFKEKDLQKIASLTNLINLYIKTATIETLSGIENLTNLQNLNIGACKRLQSIKGISLLSKLKELHLEMCPNIKNYEEIKNLPQLETLKFINCGKIASIKFIETLPALSKLSLLANTVVVDGDLVPAKHIKWVAYKPYKHYNIKIENPDLDLITKRNMEKIKSWGTNNG